MLKEYKHESDKYTEKIVPASVTMTRKVGHLVYVFFIQGYKGVGTGQVYYKRDDALEIEHYIQANNPIQFYMLPNIGVVLTFETPQVVTDEAARTDEAIDRSSSELFRPSSVTKSTISVV
jgi:hypothetical protein